MYISTYVVYYYFDLTITNLHHHFKSFIMKFDTRYNRPADDKNDDINRRKYFFGTF